MINPESELAEEFWSKGRSDQCPIIDFHAHMDESRGVFLPRASAEAMLRSMDSAGVRLALFCGNLDLFSPTTRNSRNIAAVQRHPHRFRAYFAVNPNFYKPEDDLDLFCRHRDVFVGFKTLPDYFGYPLDHKRYEPYWEFAERNRLIVLTHTWGGSQKDGPDQIRQVLESYPRLTLIAGHAMHGEWERAAEMARDYPGLYLDTCAVMDDRGALELFVDVAGSEKILFGTDIPWFDYHYYIGAVLSSTVSDDEMKDIFYRNGARLLSRFPWFEEVWSNVPT